MECIYCGAGMDDEGPYGRLALHQDGKFLGRIYRCPNHEGFDTKKEAREYGRENNRDENDWEEIVCKSSVHYVSGSFYTNLHGDLLGGYPC